MTYIMKTKQLFILTACILMSLTACYDDKGNYDYRELDKVEIDTANLNMLEEYAIMRYDSLKISPNIRFNGQLVTEENQAPLDYLWTIYSATSGVGANTVIDTIGTKAHLATEITRTGGAYYVQLTVTNRNDGIKQFFRTQVIVSEIFDGGWMVFYERADAPGHSDLALVYNEWVKSNSRDNRIFKNLYEENNGELLPGAPVRCLDIAVSLTSGNNYIGLCTDRTLVGVSENGFERALSFSDFFYQAPATEAPIWYGQHGSGVMSGQSSEVLLNNKGEIYTNTYSFSATEGRTTRFGVAKQGEEIGELAAWNAEIPNTMNYGVVVYDQTYKCFRYAAYNSMKLERFGNQDLTVSAFDINNTGAQMLMSDWGVGTSQGVSLRPHDYSIMAIGDERYLAVTNFSSSTPADNNIGIGWYDLNSKCPGIKEATSMAASHVGSFIYYASGNKVYKYAYDGRLSASAAWTAKDPNEVVTCVRIMKYYHGTVYGYGMVPTSDNMIHIATWNEETQEGHLYQYKINAASGIISKTKCYDYAIPGKVKDMAWKFSLQ